jgi:putative phosphonate metabolism protein
MSRRYGIYAAPPSGSALAAWGSAWLGRDAETGALFPPLPLPGWTPEAIARVTSSPRQYGLHATLKPPFRLAAGKTEADLTASLEDLAANLAPPPALPLALAALEGFLALVPAGDASGLHDLAASCVVWLDPLRAPPEAAELARRRRAPLSPQHEANLVRWGYPYVFDAFRFHLTLSGNLDATEQAALADALAPLLRSILAEPLRLADIALFIEDAGAPFRLARRFPFGRR